MMEQGRSCFASQCQQLKDAEMSFNEEKVLK